jgi:hypothetical protein
MGARPMAAFLKRNPWIWLIGAFAALIVVGTFGS